MSEEAFQLLVDQTKVLQNVHPELGLVQMPEGDMRIRGPLGFCIDHAGDRLQDEYDVELRELESFRSSAPTVFETGGKIPRDFRHFMDDGSLCLGAPVEVEQGYRRHKNLLRFVNDQVIPYLFSYSWKRKHGQMPFGERGHGYLGLLDYYLEYFEVSDIGAALRLLETGAGGPLPRMCPCQSGRRFAYCHAEHVVTLRQHLPSDQIVDEIRRIELALVAPLFSGGLIDPIPACLRSRCRRKTDGGSVAVNYWSWGLV